MTRSSLHDHTQTLAVHEAERIATDDAQCESLVLTNSYRFDSPLDAELKFSGARPGHVYTRISNPTVAALEQRIAALEGAEEAVAFATGMAALDAVFSACLRPGDHMLCSRDVFGTSAHLLRTCYEPLGIEIDFVDIRAPAQWREKMRPSTRLLFLETPSNPNLFLADLSQLALMCAQRDCVLVVDNTVATPVIQNPLQHGAQVVVHSAGKYIDGQGRTMGGLVATNQKLASVLRTTLRNRGSSLSPFNAWILLKSLETLHVRMCAHSEKAAYIVQALNSHPMVAAVHYPGGKHYAFNELAASQHTQRAGHGGLFGFTLKGDKALAWSVMERLRLIAISTNIGDTKSLVTHPASTTHGRIPPKERALAQIGDNLLRISVGLECQRDVRDDLLFAIDGAVNAVADAADKRTASDDERHNEALTE